MSTIFYSSQRSSRYADAFKSSFGSEIFPKEGSSPSHQLLFSAKSGVQIIKELEFTLIITW
jgi:hypothetical protein